MLRGLELAARDGLPGSLFRLDATTVWPRIIAVLEGDARRAEHPGARRLEVVRAEGAGDDEVVAQTRIATQAARAADASASIVLVVTADKELRRRVSELGAQTTTPRRFRDGVPMQPDEPA